MEITGKETESAAAQAAERLRNLAKPPGSLGLLEAQAQQALTAWGTVPAQVRAKHIIFAADNGVVQAGVVAQLAAITYMQCRHMLEGTSAVTCFCRANGIPYEVVDVGIDSADAVGMDRKIARGTRNFAVEAAMTDEQYQQALSVGAERVEAAWKDGYNLLSFGEMGIGNTTTSAAVLTALAPPGSDMLAGYGSARGNYGLVLRKRRVIRQALDQYPWIRQSPAEALRCVGGFDLAALCGAMMACAKRHIPFYIDGFITAVALVCAVAMEPSVRQVALPSHLSREPGMAMALRLCGIDEYDVPIQAGMSLGEGTGAVLGVVLLRTMMYAVTHMATLDDINAAAQRHEQEQQKE
ncbi:nicotinate-nucleotide--dimethylbenzimidazole phosphoribosyltransferase [uncultured Megasphaera sp.]|uniref:nicotinate-nucleotide--dimethylbenzimidazole phosphoribosyltransferase n=1 Tax=uncultured Megasphaera sp. TaxID=165188 RepID=UPI00265B6563|nr:nicotinate-nucleotide--dimethylbenzimidazole phosphoribosyltransferase [uncultured Megasphaera sp.]